MVAACRSHLLGGNSALRMLHGGWFSQIPASNYAVAEDAYLESADRARTRGRFDSQSLDDAYITKFGIWGWRDYFAVLITNCWIQRDQTSMTRRSVTGAWAAAGGLPVWLLSWHAGTRQHDSRASAAFRKWWATRGSALASGWLTDGRAACGRAHPFAGPSAAPDARPAPGVRKARAEGIRRSTARALVSGKDSTTPRQNRRGSAVPPHCLTEGTPPLALKSPLCDSTLRAPPPLTSAPPHPKLPRRASMQPRASGTRPWGRCSRRSGSRTRRARRSRGSRQCPAPGRGWRRRRGP